MHSKTHTERMLSGVPRSQHSESDDVAREVAVTIDDFLRLELRVGTVLSVTLNEAARVPAYALTVDFGREGVRTTSAQLVEEHNVDDLLGTQVVAVVNLPPKRVAGVRSEVLVLAAVEEGGRTVVIGPAASVRPGTRVR